MTIGHMCTKTTLACRMITVNSMLLRGHWIDRFSHVQSTYSGIREALDDGFFLIQLLLGVW